MRPLQSLPACLLHSTCLEGVWQGAHRHEGATTATMLELVFCMYQLPRNARCICDITQLRYETSLCSEDDSTSPTKWRMQRHKDFQSHLIFFKSNWFHNNHPYWCWVSSLSTGTVIYSSCMDTTQPHLSSSSQEVETNKELSYLCASTNNSSTGTTSVCGTGASLCPGSSLISTDEKFQKSRNNVAFQVAQVADSYGALMIGSKKSRNNSCLSPAIVI